MRQFSSRLLRFISQLLKSIWLFFPGILFLLLPVFCFWALGQGKDIVIAFIDNNPAKSFFHFNYTRTVFFLVIGFWVYVSWYSSRIISYIKRRQEDRLVETAALSPGASSAPTGEVNNLLYEIGQPFLDEFPRIIGNACFLVLELAVLQLPLLHFTITVMEAWIIFFIALIALRFINSWISKTQATRRSFRNVFWILLYILIGLVIVISFIDEISIFSLLFLLLLFHVVFIYYTNLRRVEMDKNAEKVRLQVNEEIKPSRVERSMNYFCVPPKEHGYYSWFLNLSIAGIVLYFINIISLPFARHIGPFPTVILAFAVLLAFGNLVTAFSVRSGVNFHFILFVLAFFIGGFHETHYVRTNKLADTGNDYENKPGIREYVTAWLNQRNVLGNNSPNGYDIYFVMANGGASRSGYWTSSVLGRIEDTSLNKPAGVMSTDSSRFSDHVFCLSGTSGGGVGVATFFALLRDKENKKDIYRKSAQAFLKQDYFTYTFARMLGPDFFNYIIPFSARMDRAAALEKSFETSAQVKTDSLLEVPFYDNLSNFPAMKNGMINLPILCVNTTRMQDGNPGVVTNINLDADTFNNRIDVVKLLDHNMDISLTSAAILGARFPYLSPAGRIGRNYFVDGGYFDNSGAGVVQEMIRAIINIGKQDFLIHGDTGTLYRQVARLHFKVLHITNSPVIADSTNIKAEAPIKNDLLSPVLTIMGAYDMQTTVNDVRLINFINDINAFAGNKADYTQVPLYEDNAEWASDPMYKKGTTEASYAMNWFMSDTTLSRINNRVLHNPSLDTVIHRMLAGGKSALSNAGKK